MTTTYNMTLTGQEVLIIEKALYTYAVATMCANAKDEHKRASEIVSKLPTVETLD